MGVRGLQSYILAKCPDSLIPIDLTGNTGTSKKRLIVIEGWSCLRSVYGPHMDFICGGQYQEFRASIRRFVNTFQQVANCELVVFFAGGVSEEERAEWARRKSHNRDTIGLVMQSLRQKGYSPDRKHFLPNETHVQVFRQVLLSCHVKVVSTPYSTGRAMLDYAFKNEAYGILANDSDFIMANAPRYFSLHHLRISGNTISTMMIDRDKIAESLELPLTLFPLLSCLLGNDIVCFELLESFHSKLLALVEEEDGGEDKKKEVSDGLQLVGAVISFVKELPEEIRNDIPGHISEIIEKVLPEVEDRDDLKCLFLRGLEQYNEATPTETENAPSTIVTVTVTERGKPATEATTPTIATEPDSTVQEDERETTVDEIIELVAEAEIVDTPHDAEEQDTGDKEEEEEEKDNDEQGQDEDKDGRDVQDGQEEEKAVEDCQDDSEQEGEAQIVTISAVTGKVLRSAHTAHASGTLNTQLYPLLSTGQFSLGPIFEDPKDKDIITSAQLFRSARQRIYGLLFGIGRASTKTYNKKPLGIKIDTERQVTIQEFVVDGTKRSLLEHEDVPAIPVHSLNAKTAPRKPTPHIEKLWIGMSAKIQDLRRSTLCAIMNCKLPSFCTPNIIANEYLIVCIVLRYMLSSGNKVLREYELDAFLATALSPQLHCGPSFLYKITPGVRLTSRGCTIAHMFVRGVETVLLANDACNYPMGLRFCFIGNFFDGKLFQQKLGQCRANMSVFEVCDGEPYAVEYLRYLKSVIMEDLVPRVVFAPALVPNPGSRMPRIIRPPPPPPPFHMKPPPSDQSRGRGGGTGGYNTRPPYHPTSRPQYRPQAGGGGNTGSGYHHQNGYHQNHRQPPSNYQYPPNGGGNRRYPSHHYDQMDNYTDHSYHSNGGGYNNYHHQRGGGGDAYMQNDSYPPYKQALDVSSSSGYNNSRSNYGGNSGGAFDNNKMMNNNNGYNNKQQGGENNPYGKRSIPDRRDTKQWINFLGN